MWTLQSPKTALLSLVVLCCTVAFVGGLSPAPKTARLVSSALAPPSRHAHHLDVHASDAPWPNAPRPNAPRPNAPAGRTPGDDPTVWLPAFRYRKPPPRQGPSRRVMYDIVCMSLSRDPGLCVRVFIH